MARAAEPLGLAVSGDGMLSSLLPPLAAREPVAAVIPIQIQAQSKLVYRRKWATTESVDTSRTDQGNGKG